MKCQGVIVKEERDWVSPGCIGSLYLRLPSASSQKLNVNPRPYHRPPNQPKCCPLPSPTHLATILCYIFYHCQFFTHKDRKDQKNLVFAIKFSESHAFRLIGFWACSDGGLFDGGWLLVGGLEGGGSGTDHGVCCWWLPRPSVTRVGAWQAPAPPTPPRHPSSKLPEPDQHTKDLPCN